MKPRIAVFTGAPATIVNSPTLVTSNKGRLPGERTMPGRFDHLVPQLLYEPVRVKIRKFSAHPLEEDSRSVYHDDGKDYYEVELRPEDGPYLLPYMARRADGSSRGIPFEDNDLLNAVLNYGGRQFFHPDPSSIFTEIDRTTSGRDEHGEGSTLDRLADYDFIRVLASGGYTQRGEVAGRDFFPYNPLRKHPRARDLAQVTNTVQTSLASGKYSGGIWMDGSPTIEETLYWLNLLIDTGLPLVGVASQRPHGQLSNDGDRNIIDGVRYIVSGKGTDLGVVGIQDERIYAAREFKKRAGRPGGYVATGGHGGILGSVGRPPVTIWFKPVYKHTSSSDVNLTSIPREVEFANNVGDRKLTKVTIKNPDGSLRWEVIPRVHMVKYGAYMEEDERHNPDDEVDILARVEKGLAEQDSTDEAAPNFHGFVLEGASLAATGTGGQMAALAIAAFSGMPVVRVNRSDPGGRVPSVPTDLTIEGSNLDANKARLLLMAAMLKLGRLPRAKDPRHPTSGERQAVIAKIAQFQEVFETH